MKEFKRLCWLEPDEGDKLRDTVISRNRLEFIKRLVLQGVIHDG